jgi:hypothetical protein
LNALTLTGNLTIAKAGAYLYLNGTNSDSELRFMANGSDRWAVGMNVGDATENLNIYNYTTTTVNFTILKASGNVGINQATPSYKLDVSGTGRFTGDLTLVNLIGSYQNTTVYNSSNTLSTTPSRGIRAQSSSIQFTDSYAIAPFYTYRSTGDWPVPYGIGWGTGGESSGIFQRYASNGSSFGDMIFYTGNDGSGAFSFRRHTWEGTTYFGAGSGELNTELFRVDWAGNASLLGILTANGDARAPIFYDSNNTAYYIDAASTSNLVGLTVANTITGSISGNAATVTTNANLTGHITSVGNATSLGSFTSAQLLAALTDETGTGANVFATSPTLVSPILGTPTSGNLANCTFPTLNQNTTGTSSNITAYTINQNVGSSNSPTFATLQLTRLNFGATGATPYAAAAGEGTGNGITFGGDEAGAGYRIFTSMENWNSSGNYSKLTLNWHTGIRIGAYTAYGGIRFYNNAAGATNPTPSEIFSIGRGDSNVRVENNLYAPVIYDSNNTAYYLDPASTSNLNALTVAGGNATIYRDLIVNGGGSGNFGNRIIVQGTATTYTYQDTTLRPTVYLNGNYPVITLNATESTNTLHGPTLQFAFNGLTTGGTTSRQIVIGTPGTGSWLDFGFSGGANGDNSSYNPHNGIGGYNGVTAMRLFSNGLLVGSTGAYPNAVTSTSFALDVRGTGSSNTDFRAPIFYDTGNTAYYCDPAGSSNFSIVTSADFYTAGWFRNNTNGYGIYNQVTAQHFYSDDVSYWNVASSSSAQGIRLRTGGHAGTVRGYFYADTNNDVGLLNQSGSWRVRVVGGDYVLFDGSSIRAQIFYDSNDTGYYTNPAGDSVLNGLYVNSYNNLANDYKDILVYGNANTYYVVLIQGEYLYSFGRYSVTRGYNWTGPDTWNTASHKGGLTLDWEWSGDTAWGGNDKAIRIIEFNESYSTMVAGLGYPVNGGVIIWLRGGGVGGAQYRIRTPIGSNATVTAYDGVSATNHSTLTTFTAADSSVFTTRANTNNVSAEILARYPVRSAASLYNDNNLVVDIGSGTQTKSGIFASAASVRAPIFYDTDNTGYYLDPNGTSNLYDLTLTGSKHTYLYINPGNPYEAMVRYNGGSGSSWYVGKRNASQLVGTESFHFYSEAAAATVGGIDTSGNIFSTGSVRSPIFYDSNDTAYYLDPRSTSVLSGLKLNGVDNEAAGTGSDAILWINKPNNNDWGIRVTGNLEYLLKLEGATSHTYNIQGMANGSEFWRCGTDLLYHNSNIRAPIFYDSANTAYYIDAASTSNLLGLTVANTITGSISGSSASCTGNAASVTNGMYLSGDQFISGAKYFTSNKGAASTVGANATYSLEAYSSDAGAAGMSFHRGGYYAVNMGLDPDNILRIGGWSASANRLQLDMSGNLTVAGAMYGTNFIDSDNTAYFCNPASTSNLVGLTVANTITGSITGNAGGTSSNITAYTINQSVGTGNSPTFAGLTLSPSAASQFQLNSPSGTQGLWIRAGYDSDGTATPSASALNVVFQSSGSSSGTFSFVSGNTKVVSISGSALNSLVAIQQSGNQVLHAGNVATYALPIGGGTLTGGLTVTNLFGNANSASLYANTASYGSWKIGGTRNGWYGIEFESGSNLMMNSAEVGFHRNGYGWQLYWSAGTAYCLKGNPGGGTQATILDSSNQSYAWAMNQNVTTGSSPTFVTVNGTSINIAGNGAGYDTYGTIGVTEPAGASNYSYYGLTRQSNIGCGFGLTGTTGALGLGANAFWFGSATSTAAGVMGTAYIAFNGSSLVAVGTVDATQFRDRDNTAYYIDAASTSNLLGLTVTNTITGSITGNAGGSSTSCTGNSATVTVNYNNDSNASYQMLWGSGNSVYGTAGVTLNPSTDYITATSFNASDWFRSSGNTGWYNSTWGGGIYMTDSTWIRTYNSKYFYCDTIIQAGSDMRSPRFYDGDNTAYYVDPASTSILNLVRTRNTFGEKVAVTSVTSTTVDTQYNVTELTMSAFISTLTFSNIQASGIVHMWTIVTLGNGSATSVTWPAAVKWPGGTAPNITGTNTKRDIYQFVTYDGGTTIYAIIVGQNL